MLAQRGVHALAASASAEGVSRPTIAGACRAAAQQHGAAKGTPQIVHVGAVYLWRAKARLLKFLIQRWEVPVPEAPAGIAIIGADPEREGEYLQDSFDSRGVARLYKMSFEDGVWKLWRDEPDFSPLDFSQRFTGIFSDDGKTIAGTWEISHDGKAWEHDFDLTYTKAG